jgi:hypothetical protein
MTGVKGNTTKKVIDFHKEKKARHVLWRINLQEAGHKKHSILQ